MRNLESIGELPGALADRIGYGDDLAAIVALKAGNVSQCGPVPGTKDSNSDRQGSLPRVRSSVRGPANVLGKRPRRYT